MRRYLILLILPVVLTAAPRFTAQKTTDHGIEIVRLADAAYRVELSVVPSIGNRAYELKVHGKNLLYFPTDLAAFQKSGGRGMNGVPFLAPWGNRIPGGGFWANGERYTFNTGLHNLSVNSTGVAIHGMLTASPLWEVTNIGADKKSAHVTSRLQFWRHPDLMANWPFAHEYEMTYTLTESGLQVAIAIKNLSAKPMPVVIGFHPYFQIPDVPRAEWNAHVAARKHVEMDAALVATGEMTDSGLADQVSLKDHKFDDGYTDLVRDGSGRANFSVQAADKKIEVVFGPNYKVAIVYSPAGQDFICFEPMAAVTNGVNLAHDGKYNELQTVAPSTTWQESFWVRFSGF
jgi:aldose 1-epimerase